MGSGFVISKDGYILTNHHVVDGADEIVVRFSDRREFTAEVVGTDRRSEFALPKIEASGLPVLEFAEPDRLNRCLGAGHRLYIRARLLRQCRHRQCYRPQYSYGKGRELCSLYPDRCCH